MNQQHQIPFYFLLPKIKLKLIFFLENNYCKYGEVAFANGYKKKDINPQIIIHFLRNSSSPSNGNLREHHACGFNEHIIYFFDSQRSFRTRKNLKGTQIPASVINFSFVDYEQLEDTIRNMDLPIVWTNNDGFIESQSYRKDCYYKILCDSFFFFFFFPYNYFTYFNIFFPQ